MSSSFSLRYALVCDDVRQENNGKGILIGVYTGDIVLLVPGPMRFYLWAEGENAEDYDLHLRMRILDESGKSTNAAIAEIQVRGDKNPVIVAPGAAIFRTSGEVVWEYERDGEWIEILHKRVQITNPDSTELLQPSLQSQPADSSAK